MQRRSSECNHVCFRLSSSSHCWCCHRSIVLNCAVTRFSLQHIFSSLAFDFFFLQLPRIHSHAIAA